MTAKLASVATTPSTCSRPARSPGYRPGAHAAAVGGAAPAVQAPPHHRRLRADGRAAADPHRGAAAGRQRGGAAEQPDQPGRRRHVERAELHAVRAVRDHRLLPRRRLRAVLRRHRRQRGPVGVAALHAGHAGAADAAAPAEVVRRAGAVGRARCSRWRRSRWSPAASRSASRTSRRRSGSPSGRARACCGWPGCSATSPSTCSSSARWPSGSRRSPTRRWPPSAARCSRCSSSRSSTRSSSSARIRDWFPTAGEFAWTDLLQTPVDSADLFRGVIQSLVYAADLHRARVPPLRPPRRHELSGGSSAVLHASDSTTGCARTAWAQPSPIAASVTLTFGTAASSSAMPSTAGAVRGDPQPADRGRHLQVAHAVADRDGVGRGRGRAARGPRRSPRPWRSRAASGGRPAAAAGRRPASSGTSPGSRRCP